MATNSPIFDISSTDGAHTQNTNVTRWPSMMSNYSHSSSNVVICFITLADDRVLHVDIDSKAEGQECLDKICKNLGLSEESDYFGLQYVGNRNELLWLNMRNRLSKQIPRNPPYNLYLRVKFYVPPHYLLLEETRHQFFLNCSRQLKLGVWDQDITHEMQGHLIALMAQAEFGNFNISTTPCKYACFWPDNREEIPGEVIRMAAEHHRSLANSTRQHVEYELLQMAENLPLYGTFFYEAKDCFEKRRLIGVGPEGAYICSSTRETIERYQFARIQKVTVSDRVVYFHICEDDASVRQFGYRLVTHKAANSLYRCVTEMHSFYNCETVRPEISEQTSRDFRGAIVSLLSEHATKDFVFDIRRTLREAYDSARRRLFSSSSNASPPRSPVDKNAPANPITGTGHSHSLGKADSTASDEFTEIQATLDRWKDSALCRVCMDEVINRTFFPCGHSMCCARCADRLDDCPGCRKKIEIRHTLYLPFPIEELRNDSRSCSRTGSLTSDDSPDVPSDLTVVATPGTDYQVAPELTSTETLVGINIK